jgi:hypothetical protein
MNKIQKGNFIKPIFLFAFTKWILEKGNLKVWNDSIAKHSEELLLSLEDIIDKRLQLLTLDMHENIYYFFQTGVTLLPFEDENEWPYYDYYIYHNFYINIHFSMASFENDSIHDIKLLPLINKYQQKYVSETLLMFEKKLKSLNGETLLNNYDASKRFYFDESIFEELYAYIREANVLRLRGMILDYK